MPHFIHLADSRTVGHILRTGIASADTPIAGVRGCYCTPVCRDHYRTHQWLRELKRRGMKSMHAVQFRLKPDHRVWIGRYNGDHVPVTAAEAAHIFAQHVDGLGLEVVVPERIPRSAIVRTYVPPQVVGWRFYPEAKGKRPFCGCRYCNRGEINAYRVIKEDKP